MVELIVVVAIIAILAAIAMPAYDKIKNKAREVRAMEEIRGIDKAISAFLIDNGKLPTSGELHLKADPWGNAYVYEAPGRMGFLQPLNDDYDLYSTGANGQRGPADSIDDDDIARAGNGAFVGLGKNL